MLFRSAEIVHISESTQWNGFNVLDGTAGERVGEMPVYKTTSVSQMADVFINPTTLRTVSGADAGEIETLTFTANNGSPTTGVITVAGVPVTITSADLDGSTDAENLSNFAAKIKSTLEASPAFDKATSGRTITQSGGVLTITYAASDGDIGDIAYDVGATGVAGAVATKRSAVASGTEYFSSGGAFLKPGALNFSVSSAGAVTASFLGSDNQSYTLTGKASTKIGRAHV